MSENPTPPESADLGPWTQEQVDYFRSMRPKISAVRSVTALDDEGRVAGDLLADLTAQHFQEGGWSMPKIAAPLGYNPRALRALCERRETLPLPKSQERFKYQGKTINARHRTATHFACGHERTEENSYYMKERKGLDTCRTCQLDRVAEARAGKPRSQKENTA